MKYLTLLLFLTACSTSKVISPSTVTAKTVCTTDTCIIAFGDSITAGYGTSNMAETSYAGVIAKRYNLELTDLGIGHSTIVDEMPGILNYPYKPFQTVVMLSGYNDMRNYGTDADHVTSYGAYLKQAMDIWAAAGVQVYIGTCLTEMNYADVYGGHGSALAASLYANQVITVAAGYPNVHVVDTNTLWVPTVQNMDSDLVHPNDIGAREIAGVFISTF